MKRTISIILAFCMVALSVARAQEEENIKTGLNFGPLPALAYDADKGFQYGALLNIYNFGDGSNYPNFNSYWYLEASFFTKGSKLFQFQYDNKNLIPGVRWSNAVSVNLDKAFDFYGFNGYQSNYNYDAIQNSSFGYTPFYRFSRKSMIAKSDFIVDINKDWKWEAGLHLSYFKTGSIDRTSINKGKSDSEAFPDSQSTLYENYVDWGLITESEAEGGFNNEVRLGMVYDTRDKEGAPTQGIWAEGHVSAAPKWLGTTNPYYRYSFTWRQYFPIIKDSRLTFAYRFNYEGTIGDYAPFYIMPWLTVMGFDSDKDGMGGYRTVRGIMRDRIMGLDTGIYNVELRWRSRNTVILKQNISFGLSAFSDGAMAFRGRDMTYKGTTAAAKASYDAYMASQPKEKDIPHITTGAGFRFIMNENFIIVLEYGMPLSKFMKESPIYHQDGNGAFYINLGYLF